MERGLLLLMKIIDRPDLKDVPEGALWALPLFAELIEDPHPVYLELAATKIQRKLKKLECRLSGRLARLYE